MRDPEISITLRPPLTGKSDYNDQNNDRVALQEESYGLNFIMHCSWETLKKRESILLNKYKSNLILKHNTVTWWRWKFYFPYWKSGNNPVITHFKYKNNRKENVVLYSIRCLSKMLVKLVLSTHASIFFKIIFNDGRVLGPTSKVRDRHNAMVAFRGRINIVSVW